MAFGTATRIWYEKCVSGVVFGVGGMVLPHRGGTHLMREINEIDTKRLVSLFHFSALMIGQTYFSL